MCATKIIRILYYKRLYCIILINKVEGGCRMSDIASQIESIVGNFSTQPYLFLGSGFSKRYLGTPTWSGLLFHLISLIKPTVKTKLAYGQILNDAREKADNPSSNNEVFSIMASLIEKEFNNKFYSEDNFREGLFSEDEVEQILDKEESAFKKYIANYFFNYSSQELQLHHEIEVLLQNRIKIAGIITTNYDQLCERLFNEFKVYKDQFELLGSMSYSFSEIYKIHGCCTKSESIVFTKEDYDLIKETNMYLAAKLLTIFVEFPIIFIGYGLQDEDIRMIFEDISKCLRRTDRQKFKNRIVFLGIPDEDYQEGVYRRTEQFDSQYIDLIDIRLHDFNIFYKALSKIKPKYRVDLARKLFSEVSKIIITNEPSNTVYASALQNPNIKGSELACYLGTQESVGRMSIGYIGIGMDELYRDVIFDDRGIADTELLLNEVFPKLRSSYSRSYFPIYKYNLTKSEDLSFLDANSYLYIKENEHEILTQAQKDNLEKYPELKEFCSIEEIKEIADGNLQKELQYITYSIQNLDMESVLDYLMELVGSEKQSFKNVTDRATTDLRKLICVYDFLVFKQ